MGIRQKMDTRHSKGRKKNYPNPSTNIHMHLSSFVSNWGIICPKMIQHDSTWSKMQIYWDKWWSAILNRPLSQADPDAKKSEAYQRPPTIAPGTGLAGAGAKNWDPMGFQTCEKKIEKAQKVLVFWELHWCKTFEYLWSARRFGREGLVRLDVGRFLLLLQRWWRWRRWRWRLWQEASYEDRQRPAATSQKGLTLSNGLCCSCQSAPPHLMMQRVTSSRYTADCVAELLRVCVLEVCAEQLQCSAQNCVNSSSSCAAVLCRSRTGRSKLYELQPKFRLMESSIRDIFIFRKLSWGLENDNTLFKKR